MNLDNLFDLYPDPVADHNSSDPACTNLLATWAAYVQPKVVVEAGTYLGRTSCAIAKALRQTNTKFHIYTAEIRPNFIKQAQTNIDDNGLADHITIFEGDYLEMLQVIEEPIDFAYIDGGVRWPMIEATMPKLSEHGVMFVDDMNNRWGDTEGYEKTIAACSMLLQYNRGLGIIGG